MMISPDAYYEKELKGKTKEHKLLDRLKIEVFSLDNHYLKIY